jgi:hypothetical protein
VFLPMGGLSCLVSRGADAPVSSDAAPWCRFLSAPELMESKLFLG